MCGIAGLSWEDRKLVEEMNALVSHRGPDADAVYVSEVSLGHRRLAIIDLSDKGKQPMQILHYVITFNGEIYNYKEIKEELGGKFVSDSDTEVIVRAYHKWGVKCLEKFNGMFAFCIYDTRKKEMFLARDRFGIKPLYYTLEKGLAFGSEIKSLLPCLESRRVSSEGLKQYFKYRFTLDETTMVAGVKKFLPGQYMLYDVRKQKVVLYKKYYSLKVKKCSDSFGEAQDKVRSLVEKSVEQRMIADVPVACLLSGGVDSTIVTLLAKKHNPNLNTFSIGFDTTNELSYARLVAKQLKTKHHEFKITRKNIMKYLEDVVYHMDEPIADPGFFPVFVLSKEVSKHNKVVLSGDGADEVFAGYDRYKLFRYGLTLRHVINFNLNHEVLKQLQAMRGKSPKEVFTQLSGLFSEEELKSLKIGKGKNTKWFSYDRLTSGQYYDIMYLLPNYFFMKADKMSAAWGLEQRVPFMDHEVVEYAMSLPASYRLRFWNEKSVLKKAFYDVPPEILKRRKHGFNVPITYWFKHELGDLLRKVLKENNHNLYDSSLVLSLLDEVKGRSNDERYNFLLSVKLWGVLMFELWYKRYMHV